MSSHASTNALILLYLALTATAASAALELGVALPLWLAILSLLGLFIWGAAAVSVNRRSLLPRFMLLVYVMPFSVTLGYLFNASYVWCHGARAIEYCRDPQLMSQLVLIGIIGLLGLLAGYAAAVQCWGTKRRSALEDASHARNKTLGPGTFVMLLAVSLFCSWLDTPSDTIFESVYDKTAAPAASISFNSANMVSYVLLLLLYIDAERETIYRSRQRRKMIATLAASLFITVYFQVLRGHRECTMLIVGLGSLYATGPHSARTAQNIVRLFRCRVASLLIPAVIVSLLFITIGSLRFTLSEKEIGNLDMLSAVGDGFEQNTWTAVLLTNLGLAAEYHDGTLEYDCGQTYWDYLLSLPPGPVSYALGYERPLDTKRGPAWWYQGLAAGGIHAVCVPFKNFGPAGAFCILGLYGFLIARCEMINRGSLTCRLIYAATISLGMHWFWYGDMYIIRSLMCAGFLAWMYPYVSRYWGNRPSAVAAGYAKTFAPQPNGNP